MTDRKRPPEPRSFDPVGVDGYSRIPDPGHWHVGNPDRCHGTTCGAARRVAGAARAEREGRLADHLADLATRVEQQADTLATALTNLQRPC